MEIGNAIRYLRKQKGWTQSELAEHTYTSKGNISNLENGNQRYSATVLDYISQAFGCPISQIFLLAEYLARAELGEDEPLPIELLFMQLDLEEQKSVRYLVEQLIKRK